MKKSLLLGITGVTLIALTATTLYAQTATGTSIIDKMKAAVGDFTLSASLNPGETGLKSAPITGKKTGSILTAGEWNRVLELLGQGGGGGLQISFKKDYSKDGNSTVPTTEDIGSHDFCALTRYGEGQTSDSTAGYCKVEKGTDNKWNVSIQALNNNINCQVTCFTGGGGSSSSASSSWVDVPLTDTNPFEIDNCEYRFRMSGVAGNGVIPGFSQTHWYYVTYKSADAIANAAWVYLRSGNKQIVYVIDTSNNGVLNVTAAWGWRPTKIEKLCGGVSGTTSSPWTSTCPTGMSLVGTAGTREAFCIETNVRTGTIYHNAAANCRTAGKSLCTYKEWTTACLDQDSATRKPVPALVGIHASAEWVLSAQTWSGGAYQGGMVIGHFTNSGSPSCLNASALDDDVEPTAATIKYRCCSY